MTPPEQSKKNIKLALILTSVALVFALGFVFKMMVLGR
ncbi:MAG: cytochrome oxidase small assembly protein [Cytophagales bacterium]|nr:cytochrome oxidase small assembly protein [Cytophagales bacterium]